MRISREEIRNLEDGIDLVVFLSGSDWDKDFGKAIKVIKIGNRLVKNDVVCAIDDIDSGDELDIQAAIKEDI